MIAIDWGTSSLRAYRLGAQGEVLDQRGGAMALLDCQGRFATVLAERIAGWDDDVVVMAGMVGSRNGWREAPYVACPAGEPELAAALMPLDDALPGRRVFVVPGVSSLPQDTPPDVMRGEETQLVGLAATLRGQAGPHVVCLPGTHAKWATWVDGGIRTLRTAMTGELYALLRRHSLLSALMPASADDDGDDAAAFMRGVQAASAAGGLPNHLFGVRTLGLFGSLPAGAAPSYLSGLLIGHELNGLLDAATRTVHLLGAPGLTLRYERALAARGVTVVLHPESLAAQGLFRLARAASLVP